MYRLLPIAAVASGILSVDTDLRAQWARIDREPDAWPGSRPGFARFSGFGVGGGRPVTPETGDADLKHMLIDGVRLEGTEQKNGQIPFVEILSRAGTECRLRNLCVGQSVTLYRNGEEWQDLDRSPSRLPDDRPAQPLRALARHIWLFWHDPTPKRKAGILLWRYTNIYRPHSTDSR